MKRALLIACVLLMGGCSKKRACIDAMTNQFGASTQSALELCTADCEDYAPKFGLPVERCKWMQAGAKGDPP